MLFPTTYVAEQGFNQVLHMRNKFCNHLDMNKTGGNVTQLKLTNLQPASKNLQKKARGKVSISWKQLFFETNNVF